MGTGTGDGDVVVVVGAAVVDAPVAAGTATVHVWCGERLSPSSETAGNVPPAVHPPVDEENSVRATDPLPKRRTSPAVWATAASVAACELSC